MISYMISCQCTSSARFQMLVQAVVERQALAQRKIFCIGKEHQSFTSHLFTSRFPVLLELLRKFPHLWNPDEVYNRHIPRIYHVYSERRYIPGICQVYTLNIEIFIFMDLCAITAMQCCKPMPWLRII